MKGVQINTEKNEVVATIRLTLPLTEDVQTTEQAQAFVQQTFANFEEHLPSGSAYEIQ